MLFLKIIPLLEYLVEQNMLGCFNVKKHNIF